MRRIVGVTGVTMILLAPAGCGDGTNAVMPDVTGKTLDTAKSEIQGAGIEQEVQVDGGGTFGVMVESNWQVCEQSPAAGAAAPDAPRLVVDRDCGDTSTEPATSTPSAAPEQQNKPRAKTETVLTPSNSKELGALLDVSDSCDESIAAFADKYAKRTIKFNGSIANIAPHGNNKTRYDILIYTGGKGPQSENGPAFKFSDVGRYELHFTEANAPDGINAGDRFRFKATIDEYNADQCLLYLTPVATRAR